MPVDDALALLALAVLYQIPLFLAAMACTWLVHEWSLHRGARLNRWSLVSRAFWTRGVWDHPGFLFPSYLLLFVGFLALFGLPLLSRQGTAAADSGGFLLGLAFALAWPVGLLALGFAALRVRLRSHMA